MSLHREQKVYCTLIHEKRRLIDVPTFTGHVVRLAQANVWPVICGSMGEAHHLTNEERVTLVKAARKALDEAGLTHIPIMAGT